jgi:hypothetical protein
MCKTVYQNESQNRIIFMYNPLYPHRAYTHKSFWRKVRVLEVLLIMSRLFSKLLSTFQSTESQYSSPSPTTGLKYP